MLDIATRRKICEDTITRSPNIAAVTPNGSLISSFIPSQLAPLSRHHPLYPSLTLRPIRIHNSDAFALARTLHPSTGKIGVLNLASDREPAGGWRYTLSRTQEEALCYSSTLYASLRPEWYPWPNSGPASWAGIISPGVVVFRDSLDNGLMELVPHQRFVVTVLTVAAPFQPEVTADGRGFKRGEQLRDLREKILLTLRMAAVSGVTNLVLGAMGCGAYGCPPRAVAEEMKRAVEMEEFRGWFETIAFAVYAGSPSAQANLGVFRSVFAG